MRVLVASDAIAGCDARSASEAIARAFQSAGAEVAVVVFEPEAPRPSTVDELRTLLQREAVIDLRGLHVDDHGASLLTGFDDDPQAAVEGLRAASRTETVIVEHGDSERSLAGIDGLAVTRSREAGDDLAAGLAAEQQATRWLERLGIDDQPGAGAAQGLGSVFLAAGVSVLDPFEYGEHEHGFSNTAQQADLIVTGCTDLDFHVKGGELVNRIVAVGERVLRPVVTISGRNFVSGRELRTAGIESAHAVYSGAAQRDVTSDEIEAVAERVARTWRLGKLK